MAPEKIEAYERRIKELEEKAMHLEIDKRAREQIINMLKEDRETLFAQVSNHVRTITDQARVIGQLERPGSSSGRAGLSRTGPYETTDRPCRKPRDQRRPSGHPSLSARTSLSGPNDLSSDRQQNRNPASKTRRP